MSKSVWTSKTLWVNLLAVVAVIAQGLTGKELLDPSAQVAVLAVINYVLRLITKEPVAW